jgi:ribonuclease Z
MEAIFLGTSCMVPTKERNHQAIFIPYKEEGILVDCGEGTQRQFKIADIKHTKITKLLITHWHGDHVLGLPGLLQTLNASEYEKKLEIYGPVGTVENFNHMFKAFSFRIDFEHSITEIAKEGRVETKDFVVEAKELEHAIPTLGYAFTEKDRRRIKVAYVKKLGIPEGPLLGELQNNKPVKWKGKAVLPKDATYIVKGKKIAIILDTLPTKNAYELARDADVLIAEAVYTSDIPDKAQEYKHMTARQAAQLASQSNAKKLIITHFSQRYKTTEQLLEEARTVFENTVASYDFLKVKI